MKKIVTLLIILSVLATSCSQKFKGNDIFGDEEISQVELSSSEYKSDKKIWSVNKGIAILLDEYAKNNNGAYPDNLLAISTALSELEGIDGDSLIKKYTYTIFPDDLKNSKGCYILKVQFESEYYKKYHGEDGYFTLITPKGSCKGE